MNKENNKILEICEVAPRDGLQSLGIKLSIEERLSFILALRKAGLKKIEIGSLINAKVVPEMAQSDELFLELKNLITKDELEQISLLVPNQRGLERLLEIGGKYVAFFTASSTDFTLKNIRRTREQSLQDIKEMLEKITGLGIKTRLYISTVFDCPFKGTMNATESLEPFIDIFEMVDEISLGDTTGKASVSQVEELCTLIDENKIDKEKIWWHFHDTHQLAVANIEKTLEYNYMKYDSSAGGIGGCPFAPGAKGNIATEKLIEIAKRNGIKVSYDEIKLLDAIKLI